jgi:hypothetical protein
MLQNKVYFFEVIVEELSEGFDVNGAAAFVEFADDEVSEEELFGFLDAFEDVGFGDQDWVAVRVTCYHDICL